MNVNALYGPRSIAFAEAMGKNGEIFHLYRRRLPDGIEFIEANKRVDNKIVYKAETLEELAQITGMDPTVLKSQVQRYNGFL